MLERMEFGGIGGVSLQWKKIEAVSQVSGGNSTFTIGQNLTVGNLYHIFTTNGSSTLANATTAAEITVSSGASNLTKIEETSGYFNSAAYYSVIEHYTFVATDTTVVFNKVATAKRLGYILYDTQNPATETETTLWTNASPTSNFNTQDVTISDDYTNYKKIRFYYRASTSDSTEVYIEYTKEQIDAWLDKSATTTGFNTIGSITFMYGAYSYTRYIRSGASDATDAFYISTAYRLNAQANTQGYGIPTKITGIN